MALSNEENKAEDIPTLIARGLTAFEKKDNQAALQAFYEAFMLDSQHIEAMHWLGWTLLQLNSNLTQSEMLLRRSHELSPDNPVYQARLAWILHNLRNIDEAEYHAAQALAAAPENFEAVFILGKIHQVQGRFKEAAVEYERALQLRPNSPLVSFYSGLVQLALGNFTVGWDRYEARIIMFGLPFEDLTLKMWQGQEVPGATLLVRHEQGFGDMIFALRYFKAIRARVGRIIVSCPPPLHRLLMSSGLVDEVTGESSPKSITSGYQVYAMSLPRVFNTTLHTIPADTPYLWPQIDDVRKWNARVETLKRPRIGLVWSSNPEQEHDPNRSMELRQLSGLQQAGNVSFVSLQKGQAASQLQEGVVPFKVSDVAAELGDFEDAAAVIACLDAVVSVDTSLLHLAAAMGKPVYALPPFIDDWRWAAARETSPWYPTVRPFRQPTQGDWEGAVTALAEALRQDLR